GGLRSSRPPSLPSRSHTRGKYMSLSFLQAVDTPHTGSLLHALPVLWSLCTSAVDLSPGRWYTDKAGAPLSVHLLGGSCSLCRWSCRPLFVSTCGYMNTLN